VASFFNARLEESFFGQRGLESFSLDVERPRDYRQPMNGVTINGQPVQVLERFIGAMMAWTASK
jgi:hypothetical protein